MATELESLLALAFQGKLRDFSYFSSVPAELMELKEVALSGDGEPTLSEDFCRSGARGGSYSVPPAVSVFQNCPHHEH
jgi:hypothetical protein